MGFKALLRAKRHAEAADWLVANFDRLSPDTAVDLLARVAREPARRGSDVHHARKRAG